MNIGYRIKAARDAKKMTQEELGFACGTTKQTIFKYETGIVTNIPLDRLEKIAEVLDVSPAYLMGWDEDQEKPDLQTEAELISVADLIDKMSAAELLDIIGRANDRLKELTKE